MADRFSGTKDYVAGEDLMMAVNAAIALQRPLLIKGEPGTGKTMLALEVAGALGRPLHQWHIKSTSKAQQGLYEYDAVSRLRDFSRKSHRLFSSMKLIRPTLNFLTICLESSIEWNFLCMRQRS